MPKKYVMDKIQFLTSKVTGDSSTSNPTDDIADGPLLEVYISGSWVSTTEDVFRSWVGIRRLNGDEHHGSIVSFGTDAVYTGRRTCACQVCQAQVEPKFKKN